MRKISIRNLYRLSLFKINSNLSDSKVITSESLYNLPVVKDCESSLGKNSLFPDVCPQPSDGCQWV